MVESNRNGFRLTKEKMVGNLVEGNRVTQRIKARFGEVTSQGSSRISETRTDEQSFEDDTDVSSSQRKDGG